MASKPLISVIGSLNIDFVTTTERVPRAGETITANSLQVNAGGKGANQAVACGKASFISETEQDIEVEIIGAVAKGDPYYASLLKPTLERSGVSTRGIRELDESQTGTATILVEEGGENRILVVPGANHDGMQDSTLLVKAARERQQPAVLVMQGELPRKSTFEVLESFSSSKTQIVFNPAPVYPFGITKKVLSYVNFLVVNESECLQLAKAISKTAETRKSEDALTTKDFEAIAKDFHAAVGVDHVIVTLGAKGVFYHSKGKDAMVVAGKKVEKVVDTTAAGDTFVGYFAAALARHVAKGYPANQLGMSKAIGRANAAAAMCVQKEGAMQSIPFDYEVDSS